MINLKTSDIILQLNEKAEIISIKSVAYGNEYLSNMQVAPILRICTDEGKIESPTDISFDSTSKIMTLIFGDGMIKVDIIVCEKDTYITFEVKTLTQSKIDTVLWGPYPTNINHSIGESVGVVHDGIFAIGIQALNVKTVGGWPEEQDVFGYGNHQRGEVRYAYNYCTASRTNWGSVLQAFTRNRTKAGNRIVWNIKDADVIPFEDSDAQIVGSKIALFGCEVPAVLDVICQIEIEENLPHPIIEGEWGKVSSAATQSYLITDFSENNIQDALDFAKKAGVKYVYHPDPFLNWGHFELKPDFFSNGDESMKKCVDLAEIQGMHLGLHTLTNFTTINDKYVSPIPHSQLAKVGTAILVSNIDSQTTEIVIDNPKAFRDSLYQNSAVIGSEIIEYDCVSEMEPWALLGCKRGMYKTAATSHEAGCEIGRLWDHSYNVFFPNINIQDELSQRLVDLFNNTGLKQISFDGIEGCYAAGHEDYGIYRFVEKCYKGWNNEIVNDASMLTHYLWHLHTRMNWGEPWGESMRDGQTEMRFVNQRYFERNFFPRMMGWYLIRLADDRFEATSIDDIEWMLSKSAGFSAGFAVYSDLSVLKSNGNVELILETIRMWEDARRCNAFTTDQRNKLCNQNNEWHLEAIDDGKWNLFPVDISRPFHCNLSELQPGQPGGADWMLDSRYQEQPLRFRMRVISPYNGSGGAIKKPSLIVNGQYLTFDTDVQAGYYLVCDGDAIGKVYDSNWELIKTIKSSCQVPTVKMGTQTLSFSCRPDGGRKPRVEVKIITMGEPELVEK